MKTLFFVAVAFVLTAIFQTASALESQPTIHMKSNNVVVNRIHRPKVKAEDGITGMWFDYTINRTPGSNLFAVEFCEMPRPFDARSVYATIQKAVELDKKLEVSFLKDGIKNCIVDANLIIE